MPSSLPLRTFASAVAEANVERGSHNARMSERRKRRHVPIFNAGIVPALIEGVLSSFETLFRVSESADGDLYYLRDGRNAQTLLQIFKNALVLSVGAKAERRFLFSHDLIVLL